MLRHGAKNRLHMDMSQRVTMQRCLMKKRTKQNESAVSPVIGVMLMLVVTIIIAAVVSAFAGGLVATKEKAPQVSLETHITLTGGMVGNPTMTIKDLGGDPINTKYVKIVTSWANSTGIYHIQSTLAPTYSATPEQYIEYPTSPYTGYANYSLSSLNVYQQAYGEYYNEPYLVTPGILPAYTGDATNETALWFGNYVMQPGDVIKADGNLNYGGSGANVWTNKEIIKDINLLTVNDVVNVKLIDLKSGMTFYDKDINVEA